MRRFGPPPTKFALTQLFNMVTPPAVDVITIALAIVGIALVALAMANATLQATNAASCERAMDAVAAADAPVGTAAVCPHPPVDPPFVVADASTTGSLVATVAVGAPVGIAAGTVTGRPSLPHSRCERSRWPYRGRRWALGCCRRPWRPRRHCRGHHLPLGQHSCHWRYHRHRCWRPRLAVLQSIQGWSPVLVNVAHLLRSTPEWHSGAACLVVLF
jgi:hypothetical protein